MCDYSIGVIAPCCSLEQDNVIPVDKSSSAPEADDDVFEEEGNNEGDEDQEEEKGWHGYIDTLVCSLLPLKNWSSASKILKPNDLQFS